MGVNEEKQSHLTRLFPALSCEELAQVEQAFERYCATMWRIYERLEREHPEIIDELIRSGRMSAKVDSSDPIT